MFVDINWYGQLKILCKYIGVKTSIPFASIQHGFLTNKQILKRYLKFVPYLIWNENIKRACELKKDKNIEIIGAPFLYLNKIIKKELKCYGTLIMFIHQDNSLIIKKISDKYLNDIKRKYPGPHTIILHFTEYNSENINYFKKRKFSVVTFGPRNDENHLIKLFKSLSKTKYFITNYTGSAFYYSLYLKKKTKLLNHKINYSTNKKEKDYFKNLFLILNKEKKKIGNKNLKKKFIPVNFGYKLAYDVLGVKFVKKRKELYKIMGFNNVFKKIVAYFFFKLRPKFFYYKKL